MVITRQAASEHRRIAIADGVVELLATVGSRHTTHRAVDRKLDLPEGSTSVYFRTRADLMSAAVRRLAELDAATLMDLGAAGHDAPDASVPDLLAHVINEWSAGAHAHRQLARLELQLEARRSPELAEVLGVARAQFIQIVGAALERSGMPSRDAAPHAAFLVALTDGLIIDRLLHPAHAVSDDRLEAVLRSALS